MPGRHSTTKRPSRVGPILAAVVAVAVIVALGIYLAPRLTASSDTTGCGEQQEVSVAVPADLTPAIRAAVASMGRSGAADGCVAYSVNTVYPDSSLTQINGQTNSAATVWILDSRIRLAQLAPETRDQIQVIGNAATTPIVLGVSRTASQTAPPTWKAAFEYEDFVLPDPTNSTAAAFALAALQAESQGTDIGPVLEDVAERQSGETVPSTDILLRDARRQFGPSRWFPVTEQKFADLRMRRVNWDLTATLPQSGTTVLNYPVVTRVDSDTATDAAQGLIEFLDSSAGSSALGDAGFRSADGELLNANSLGPSVKQLPEPANLAELLTAWGDAKTATD